MICNGHKPEPVGQQHYGEISILYEELHAAEKWAEVDDSGNPTIETMQRLAPWIEKLKHTLGRIGPCPKLQALHSRILNRTAKQWERYLPDYVEAELLGDRRTCAGLLQDFTRIFCREYGMRLVPVSFADRNPEHPRYGGTSHTRTNGTPSCTTLYWNYEGLPPLDNIPSNRVSIMAHEDIHTAQDALMSEARRRKELAVAAHYLGFSQALLDSPKLHFIYMLPFIYSKMSKEQDAVDATKTLLGFFRQVDRVTMSLLVPSHAYGYNAALEEGNRIYHGIMIRP